MCVGKYSCERVKVHKQPQFTFQAETVADSSLTPNVALLVHPKGSLYSTVDCDEFPVIKMILVKADLVICSSVIGVSE